MTSRGLRQIFLHRDPYGPGELRKQDLTAKFTVARGDLGGTSARSALIVGRLRDFRSAKYDFLQ